jgi:recombination protein RecA
MSGKDKKVNNLSKDLAARGKALSYTIEQIDKKYGRGSLIRLGSKQITPVETISTGSLSLDTALGVGGVPRGRVTEIYGPEASGKTTLALHIMANCQKNRGVAAMIDAEHALDPLYASRLGVNLDDLLVSQPDSGEQALEITELLVRSSAVDVVVIDSVAALVPRAELEGEMGDTHVGLQARLMSQALRKLTAVIHKSRTCVIFINQIRMKIGVMFGSPETTPGGRALKFYSSVRIDIRRIASIKAGEQVVGNRTRAKVVKNKVAAPFQVAEFDIIYNKGISWIGDILDIAIQEKILRKSGSWVSFGETRLGQGRENVTTFFEENPDILLEVENAVFARVLPQRVRPSKEEREGEGGSED